MTECCRRQDAWRSRSLGFMTFWKSKMQDTPKMQSENESLLNGSKQDVYKQHFATSCSVYTATLTSHKCWVYEETSRNIIFEKSIHCTGSSAIHPVYVSLLLDKFHKAISGLYFKIQNQTQIKKKL